MNVLMITGDRRFGPANERYELQKSAVSELAVIYVGRSSWNPKISDTKFDVITSQDPLLRGVVARRAAKKLEARLNVQVHMDLNTLPLWKRLLARFVLRRADSVRVVSDKIKMQVLELAPRAKITVLPVYLDVAKFARLPRVPHAIKTILWVGRLEPEKDPLAAVEILKTVRAHVDAKLVVLGTGSLGDALKRSARGLPVEFAGWKDAADFLPGADVVLCTSLHESWGASMVEALAAGVPVVAPDVGVAREAGARVVPREALAAEVVQVLQSGATGSLKINMLSRQEWTRVWRESLQ